MGLSDIFPLRSPLVYVESTHRHLDILTAGVIDGPIGVITTKNEAELDFNEQNEFLPTQNPQEKNQKPDMARRKA